MVTIMMTVMMVTAVMMMMMIKVVVVMMILLKETMIMMTKMTTIMIRMTITIMKMEMDLINITFQKLIACSSVELRELTLLARFSILGRHVLCIITN